MNKVRTARNKFRAAVYLSSGVSEDSLRWALEELREFLRELDARACASDASDVERRRARALRIMKYVAEEAVKP